MMKNARGIFLISMLITLGVFAFTLIIILSEGGIRTGDSSLFDRFMSEDIQSIIIILIVLLIVIGTTIPVYRIFFPKKIKNGIKTRAKVLEVRDTGITINDNPQVGLKLQFRTSEGLNQVIETKTIASRLNVAHVQPGVTANIVYDPLKPQRIQVESFVFEEQPSEYDEGGDERPPSTTERLLELSDLRAQGLISDEEYQAKRAEILEEL